MKKQIWKTGALCLAGVVALSVTGVSVYAKTSEKKETELKEQIQDAVDDIWKSEDTSAASIDETVYVILNADGTQQKIYVSDWLKNQGEKDSYTQSTPDKEAPVSLKVTYSLDGNEISAADLNGKNGHVVIRYDYTNELYETREIAGKEEKIYVPFAVMTGMILDNDNFSNIRVSSGKVINDGSHSVVTGIVFPGLGTNLDMEEDLDDYLEIEADVTDFTMNETYCIATNSVFSRLDLSNVDDLDDLTEAMDDLEDATHQLMDGTSDLYDGVAELYDKSGDLKDGVKELSDGSKDLRDGAYKVADGTVTLRGGIGSLQSGVGTLQEGTKTLLAGTQSLQSGANDLKTGLGQLTAQNDTLNGAAAQVFDTLLSTATSQLTAAGLTVPNLTKENYSQVLDSATSNLTQLQSYDGALAVVLPQVNAKMGTSLTADQYKVIKSSVTDGNATNPYAALVTAVESNVSQVMQTAQSSISSLQTLKASLDGYNQFYTGLQTYTAGVASASAGAAKLAAGSAQVVAGASQLKDGADKLVSGSKELYDGADTLVNGASDLASGSGTLADGVNTLSDGSDKLIDGVSQLKDGAKELKDGMVEYNDEAISKLTDMDTDELQEVIDRLKATASVSESYDSFTGDNNGMDSSVKFIYKINAVK